MPRGVIHDLGPNQVYVADGLERMEIRVYFRDAAPLPYQNRLPVPIRLKVGASYYYAKLRAILSTSSIWICPDLRDAQGQRISLARVLTNNGFRNGQRVRLEVDGNTVRVLPEP